MNINRNNYEVFFIDYHDGNLAAEQVAELFLFLESHPDLKFEFDNFNNIQLENTEEPFPLRDTLKRGEINEQNFSWYMAASVEGDLSPDEQSLLDSYIKSNSRLSPDVALFRAAKLETINNEIYPDKKSLKKPLPLVYSFNRTLKYAIAAMLFISLMGGGYFIYTRSMMQSGTGIAEAPIEVPVSSEVVIAPDESTTHEVEIILPQSQNNKLKFGPALAVTNELPVDFKSNDKDANKLPVEELKIIINDPAVPVADNEIEQAVKEKEIVEESPLAHRTPTHNASETAVANSADEQYLSVWEAIRQGANNSMRKIAGKEDSEKSTPVDQATRTRTNVIDVIGKGIEKVSNDKVKVNTRYNESGALSAFNFSAGKFKIERSLSE